jgi:hypothetical protein
MNLAPFFTDSFCFPTFFFAADGVIATVGGIVAPNLLTIRSRTSMLWTHYVNAVRAFVWVNRRVEATGNSAGMGVAIKAASVIVGSILGT